MKDLDQIITALDEESARVKTFLTENNFHHGTSIYPIVARYRKELKELRNIISADYHEDNIKNYRDIEGQQ